MSASSRYRAALTLPHAAPFFVAGAIARLGAAMLGLAVLWAVRGTEGSFAVAGIATGAYAAAEAFVAPQLARWVDAYGQRRVVGAQLPVTAAAALGLLTVLGLDAPVGAWVVAAALLGATCPQVGSLTAARWRTVAERTDTERTDTERTDTERTDLMSTALALEAAVTEAAFLIGPVLVTVLATTVHPGAGLGLAALLLVGGTLALLGCRASEPGRAPRGRGLVIDRRLLTRPMLGFATLHGALGVHFGAVPICLTAAAAAAGFAPLAGPVAAAGGVASLAVGAVIGALRYGPRPWMVAGAATMTAGLLLLATDPGPVATVVGFVVCGGCVAAVVVPAAVLLQRAVPVAVYVQAVTWTGSAGALGVAVGGPLGGWITDAAGWPTAALALVAVPVVIAGSAVALTGRRGRGRPTRCVRS